MPAYHFDNIKRREGFVAYVTLLDVTGAFLGLRQNLNGVDQPGDEALRLGFGCF